MNEQEIIRFLKDNMDIVLHIDRNYNGNSLEVKMKIRGTVICEDSLPIDQILEP